MLFYMSKYSAKWDQMKVSKNHSFQAIPSECVHCIVQDKKVYIGNQKLMFEQFIEISEYVQ